MKYLSTLFVVTTAALLAACSPHPASGVWQTTQDNDYGIDKLVVAFNGRADFKTQKLDDAKWHCFWSTKDKQEVTLKCTPSTDPDKEEVFILTINDQDIAELRHNTKLIVSLTRQDENPSPRD